MMVVGRFQSENSESGMRAAPTRLASGKRQSSIQPTLLVCKMHHDYHCKPEHLYKLRKFMPRSSLGRSERHTRRAYGKRVGAARVMYASISCESRTAPKLGK
jgi:hypothetical protein